MRLVESDIAVGVRDHWQDFFQEDPDILPDPQEQYSEVQPPRVLTATYNLCSLRLTLHKAHHLVKFDGDFLDDGDRQASKRIYRVGQREKSFVWRFITKDNTEEPVPLSAHDVLRHILLCMKGQQIVL